MGGGGGQVTKRVDTEEGKWKGWNWRTDGDIMVNGALFVASGEGVEVKYEKAYSVEPKSAVLIDQLTMHAGALGVGGRFVKFQFLFSLLFSSLYFFIFVLTFSFSFSFSLFCFYFWSILMMSLDYFNYHYGPLEFGNFRKCRLNRACFGWASFKKIESRGPKLSFRLAMMPCSSISDSFSHS